MATFNDVHELYTRLQLMGTNHTRKKFEQPFSHMDVKMLEQRCASLVVYHLSESPEDLLERLGSQPLPAIDDLLAAEMQPLRRVPDIIKPTEEEIQEAAEKAAEEALQMKSNQAIHDVIEEDRATEEGVQLDVNEGSYWHSDKYTIIRCL